MAKTIFKPRVLRVITAILLIAVLLNIPILIASATATTKWEPDTDGIVIVSAEGETSGNPVDQEEQKIIRSSDNNQIIVWGDSRNETDTDLYAQKIDNNGEALWTLNGVAISSATGDQPANNDYGIISDEFGGAIIAWQDNRNDNPEIYIQNINTYGTVQWEDNGRKILNSEGGTDPSLLSDGLGGAYIAWTDSTSGNNDVLMTHVEPDGSLNEDWNPPFKVADGTEDEANPLLISAGESDIIISYTKSVDENLQLEVGKISTDTTSVWNTSITDSADDLYAHKIITDGNEGAILAYQKGSVASSDIYAQKINGTGEIMWGTGSIVSNAANSQTGISMISDNTYPENGAIITWEDNRQSGVTDIYAQRISNEGSSLWIVNGTAISDTEDNNNQLSPVLTSSGGQGAIIAFDSNPGTYTDILAQYINGSGVTKWNTGGIEVETNQTNGYLDTNPEIAGDGSGGVIITWLRDPDAGATNIHAQQITDTEELTQGMCAETGTERTCGVEGATTICATQTISRYVLTFTEIPQNISFPPIKAGETVYLCSNASSLESPLNFCSDNTEGTPPGLNDNLTVLDERNSGGFTVQVTAAGEFSDGTHVIPLENLSLVTTVDEEDPNQNNGIAYGKTFKGPKTVNPPLYVDETAHDLSNPEVYLGRGNVDLPEQALKPDFPPGQAVSWTTQSSQESIQGRGAKLRVNQLGGAPINLMDGTLPPTEGRVGEMGLFTNYILKIDPDQPAGNYSLILTYDLIDSTI
jgi:hypothetical protein